MRKRAGFTTKTRRLAGLGPDVGRPTKTQGHKDVESESVLLTLGLFRGLALALVCSSCFAVAADLYARRMEIMRTDEGQVTYFRDSVRISDGRTTITAGWAKVNESRSIAVIGDSVVIVNPDGVIAADSCVYHMDSRRTELAGRVRVEQESLNIFAPLLEYVLDERMVYAKAGLVVRARERNLAISGRQGSYDLARDYGVVDREPRMVQTQGEDSVTVTADRMCWLAGESRAGAQGNVLVVSGESRMNCDSLEYNTSRDSGLAWGSPVLTDTASRTTGDVVVMLVKSGRLDQVTIAGNAASRYRTQSGDLVEVAGSAIVVRMEDGEIDIIDVRDLYYGRVVRRPESGS